MNRSNPTPGAHGVSFREALLVWARVAALSFGGPAGQIAVMHRILVEEKRWIGERRFLHALNYCMLLPGPEAQQLAIYVGWLMHRTAGGLLAGLLFIAPGIAALMALSVVYALFGHVGPVAALFFGLKSAVLVIVIEAVIRVGRRALRNRIMVALAAAAFVGIFVFGLAFPLIILAAALAGFAGGLARLAAFQADAGGPSQGDYADADSRLGETTPEHARPNARRAFVVAAVFLVLWWGPVLSLGLTLGPDHIFTQIALFFSKMAVVTFGGAYAVLAYVAQETVGAYHWLTPGEMLDGLGMAETTPGPLIMVTQFVGFLAAFRARSGLPPLAAGVVGGLLTTWVTFTPCFLWILAGGPFVEALRGARVLNAALRAVTAAVVGVILNLAVWFALHVLFGRVTPVRLPGFRLEAPDPASLSLPSLILALAAAVAVFRFRAGMIPTLAGCSAAGVLYYLLTGSTPGAA